MYNDLLTESLTGVKLMLNMLNMLKKKFNIDLKFQKLVYIAIKRK